MTSACIQDILPLVEMPSQYIGSEVNAVKKDPKIVELSIALAFPDLYTIGTSHFGLQILYHLLNREQNIAAERVYAPDTDMESRLRSARLPLSSLETQKPLRQFDIIGFSLLYELDYTNILTILDLADIPFFAKDRDLSFPLVIAGGPCTVNPEPVADFFDAMVIGDGETVILEMAGCWKAWQQNGGKDKHQLLESWRQIQGVYIPSFFEPAYTVEGYQTLIPRYPDYSRVLRSIIPSLEDAPFPETPVVPYGRPVHDRLRLEVSRGCTRGCRFCQAGMIYRPVRERSVRTLMRQAEHALAATGYDELSLLSLSTSDYGCLPELMAGLIAGCMPEHIAVSLPSFRAGTLTPDLMTQIKQIRKTGFTIAPEAGSQRLRNVINKNITQDDIVSTVRDAFSLGWQVIKLYFMIGLPTETDEDLDAMVALVQELRKLKIQKTRGMKGHKNQINVSVNTFIPKPHTPFQWSPQLAVEESRRIIHRLKENLQYSDVQFKWQHPQVGLLEGLWARGDRRLAALLVCAWRNGCRLDGWSDYFDYAKWEKSLAETGIDIDFFTTRIRDISEPLPWDHIHTGVTRDFLLSEWEKALQAESTPDCRAGDCQACGVCDFQSIEPKVFAPSEKRCFETKADSVVPTTIKPVRYRISYAKTGLARVFGHLELANIMFRAFRRAKIPIEFSAGFHPKPKISFDDPLPVGMESLHETCVVTAMPIISARQMKDKLNQTLPEGLTITGWEIAPSKKEAVVDRRIRYQIQLKTGMFEKSRIDVFKDSDVFIKNRVNRKGTMDMVNYKTYVDHMNLEKEDCLILSIRCGNQQTVRPAEILAAVFNISDDAIKMARIVKLAPASSVD